MISTDWSEWPPSSKKLSSAPTRSSGRTASQIEATVRSRSVRGSTKADVLSRTCAGAGSARRSSLPFGVIGMRSSGTRWAGTMYDGRWSRSSTFRSPVDTDVPAAGTK